MINEKDMLILAHLRRNSRLKLTDMSKKTGIPISTIYDRMSSLEPYFLRKHTAIINFEQLGFMTRVKIAMKINRDQRKALEIFLVKHENINNVFKINNGYDYMIEAIFRNVRELDDFMDDIETKFTFEIKTTYFVIEDVLRESFLTDLRCLKVDEI